MPDEYKAPLLELYDRLIVPSEFCADGIGASHVTVVPHCFDPEFWDLRQAYGATDVRTAFYGIGAWGDRKNQLGVLKAYLGEFCARDKVSLTMWIPGAQFGDIQALLAAGGIPNDDLPALQIPDATEMAEDALLAMHASHDCFVSATRGEGWGLGLFEAAIMTNAVIAPLWGGQRDFLNEYSGHRLVNSTLTPCFGTPRPAYKNGGVALIVDKPPGMTCKQKWAEPDLDEFAYHMRAVHKEREAKRLRAGTSDDREVLETKYSYKTVGPMLLNALQGAQG